MYRYGDGWSGLKITSITLDLLLILEPLLLKFNKRYNIFKFMKTQFLFKMYSALFYH